jgi:hypothetical protein
MPLTIGPGITIGAGITLGGSSYSPLAGSLQFNGNSNYLVMTPGMTLGAGAFTIEGWFYNTGDLTSRPVLGTDQALGMSAYMSDSATMNLDRYGGGYAPVYNFGAGAFKTYEWQYIVINRNASMLETMWLGTFVNTNSVVTCTRAVSCGGGTGISGGTQIDNQNWGNSNQVGRYYGGYWYGLVTNLRITAGSAVYDSNSATITAPTAPLASLANTKYLMLGAVVTTDSSGTQTVSNPIGSVAASSTKPF